MILKISRKSSKNRHRYEFETVFKNFKFHSMWLKITEQFVFHCLKQESLDFKIFKPSYKKLNYIFVTQQHIAIEHYTFLTS